MNGPAPVPTTTPAPQPAGAAVANPHRSTLEVIRELAQTNPTAATILLGALGTLLVVSTALTLGVDLESGVPMTVYVIVAGLILVLLSLVLNQAILQQTILWFLVVLFLIWGSVYVLLRPIFPYSQPLNCICEFWGDCFAIADRVAEAEFKKNNPDVPVEVGPSIETPVLVSGVVPGDYTVYVQFGGAIRREDVVQLAQQLKGAGWNMQGADRGGERLQAAVGLSEIRYGAEKDKAAAEALAQALLESGRVSQRYKAVINTDIKPGNLEVWIGKFFGVMGNLQAKQLLKKLGFFTGDPDETGSGLQEAVEAFQVAQGLSADGILGPITTAKLIEQAGML